MGGRSCFARRICWRHEHVWVRNGVGNSGIISLVGIIVIVAFIVTFANGQKKVLAIEGDGEEGVAVAVICIDWLFSFG